MRALLDVNVLVALFDPAHLHHDLAHQWFEVHRARGWSTCPMTENGFVRVVANPAYPGSRTTVQDALDRLRRFRESGDHAFWPANASLCDAALLEARGIRGHRQVTDAYLLMLAVHHGGRLATLDGRIERSAIKGATADNLAIIRP